MDKKITSALIILVIATAIFIGFSTWAKLTHKIYADNLLPIAVTFQMLSIALAIGWILFKRRREAKL